MRNFNLLRGILEYVSQEVIIYQKARKIATNEEKSAKSKGFGITSIIFSILAILGAVGMPFLCYYLFVIALSTNLAIIGNIVLICFAITLFLVPILSARYAVVFSRAQRIINKSKISTVSKHLARVSLILSISLLIIITVYVAGAF